MTVAQCACCYRNLFSYTFFLSKKQVETKTSWWTTRFHVPAVPRSYGARATRSHQIWEINHAQIWYRSFEILFPKNQLRKTFLMKIQILMDRRSSTSEQNVPSKRSRCLHQTVGLVSIHYHIHTIALLIFLGLFLVRDFAWAVPEGVQSILSIHK